MPELAIKSQNLRGFKSERLSRDTWMTGLKRQVLGTTTGIVLLQETHVNSHSERLQLERHWCAAMGVPHDPAHPISFWSVGTQRARGVAILTNPHLVSSFRESNQSQHNDRFIEIATDQMVIRCLYAPNHRTARESFFTTLRALPPTNKLLIVGGDFNSVAHPSIDRVTTSPRQDQHSESPAWDLLTAEWRLIDVVLHGREDLQERRTRLLFQQEFHTYHREGSSRIDRIYVSEQHSNRISSVGTAPPQHDSDHMELAVKLRDPRALLTRPRRHTLYPASSRGHEYFKDRLRPRLSKIITAHLQSPTAEFNFDAVATKFRAAITHTREEMRAVRRNRRHQFKRRQRKVLRELTEAERRAITIKNNTRRNTSSRAQQIGDAMARGVSATGSFFRRVTDREWDQSVTAIEDSAGTFKPTDTIADRFRLAWSPLFEAQPSTSDFDVACPPEFQLDEATQAALMAPVTPEQIQHIIQHLHRGKRSGPDELPNDFYKDFEVELVPLMTRVCQRSLDTGSCPPSFAEALIFPIRKKGDSPNAADYRPISLLNTSYKILAKLLASRLTGSLDKIVGASQNGYISERRMEDSISTMLAALQTQHSDIATSALHSPCVILLDFTKAYDTLSRDFIFKTLEAMAFPPKFVLLIRGMHFHTSARFLANGMVSQSFLIGRGIRQGCPLAPYLFILAMEPLARAFNSRARDWGLLLSEGGSDFPLIFSGYVDDSALFLRRADLIPECLRLLERFAAASGLQANPIKSHGIGLNLASQPTSAFGINFVPSSDTTRYLGVQIGLGSLEQANWTHRVAAIQARLGIAARRSNSIADRATLLASLMLPAVLFTGYYFWPPKATVDQLQSTLERYLWQGRLLDDGTKIRWSISASTLQLPRKDGGLRLPQFVHELALQATKKALRWATAPMSLAKVAGSILLGPTLAQRPTVWHLHLPTPRFIPVLRQPRANHHPRGRLTTVWTMGEGRLALHLGALAAPSDEWQESKERWWRRLTSKVYTTWASDTNLCFRFQLPVWVLRRWADHCQLADSALPQSFASFWNHFNIIGNPWVTLPGGDAARSGHQGLEPRDSFSSIFHSIQFNSHGFLTGALTARGLSLLQQLASARGRLGRIHHWVILALINAPNIFNDVPLRIAPAIPPFVHWHYQLSSGGIHVSSERDAGWLAPVPRYDQFISGPTCAPVSFLQNLWGHAAQANHVVIQHHASLHRLPLPEPAKFRSRRFLHQWALIRRPIQLQRRLRQARGLQSRMLSWRKRDPEIADILSGQRFELLWRGQHMLTAADRFFRYKLHIGALNTGRPTSRSHPHCPLTHCTISERDTIVHVLWTCEVAQAVWQRILQIWSATSFPRTSLSVWKHSVFSEKRCLIPPALKSFAKDAHRPPVPRREVILTWRLLCRLFCNLIWTARNDEVYSQQILHPIAIHARGLAQFLGRLQAVVAYHQGRGDMHRMLAYSTIIGYLADQSTSAPSRSIDGALVCDTVLYFDGGSRGNPGPGAGGAVILQHTAHGWRIVWYASVSLQSEFTTNNIAEYHGLLLGLRRLRRFVTRHIAIVGDSDLVLQQLAGSFQVNDPQLLPLHAQVMDELDNLASYSTHHHRRRYNRMSDHLTNVGMDHALTFSSDAIPSVASSVAGKLLQFLSDDLSHLLRIVIPHVRFP